MCPWNAFIQNPEHSGDQVPLGDVCPAIVRKGAFIVKRVAIVRRDAFIVKRCAFVARKGCFYCEHWTQSLFLYCRTAIAMIAIICSWIATPTKNDAIAFHGTMDERG